MNDIKRQHEQDKVNELRVTLAVRDTLKSRLTRAERETTDLRGSSSEAIAELRRKLSGQSTRLEEMETELASATAALGSARQAARVAIAARDTLESQLEVKAEEDRAEEALTRDRLAALERELEAALASEKRLDAALEAAKASDRTAEHELEVVARDKRLAEIDAQRVRLEGLLSAAANDNTVERLEQELRQANAEVTRMRALVSTRTADRALLATNLKRTAELEQTIASLRKWAGLRQG